MWALKFKKKKSDQYYTHTRTYRILLIIVTNLCLGIAAMGYDVLNKNDELPLISTAVTLLLLGIILIAVVELFNNLKQHEAYLEAKSVFLSVASHDLSSPLTGINWAAQSLITQTQDPKQKERLVAIEQTSKAMMQTIDDALSITSLEHMARQNVTPVNTDLLELIDGVINSFKLTAAQKSVTLQRVGPWPSTYPIQVDEKQFRRVVANIVSNEIKFTYPNTEVSLTFSQDARRWSVSVHNKGPSLTEADQKHIFAIYERSKESEKSGAQGIGFGLYLAQQIILKHNGTLTVFSNAPQGVTFMITMPKPSSPA
jgi:signal transduction histidine kinase